MRQKYCKYEFYIKNSFSIKNKSLILVIYMSENTDLTYYKKIEI